MALINSEVKKFIQNLREHFKEKKIIMSTTAL